MGKQRNPEAESKRRQRCGRLSRWQSIGRRPQPSLCRKKRCVMS